MAGSAGTDLAVTGVDGVAAAVAAFYTHHTLELLEHGLRAPETATAENRLLQVLTDFFQGNGIHTVTQAVGLWTVWKDMSQVRPARVAGRFNAMHPVRIVAMVGYGVGLERLGK